MARRLFSNWDPFQALLRLGKLQNPDDFMMIRAIEAVIRPSVRGGTRMHPSFKTSVIRTIGTITVTTVVALNLTAYAAQETQNRLTASQQNALVQKYCAVCHDDAHRNGGLTLQHFDASQVDPSLAAMMVSKLNSGALGAAGLELPPRSVQDGLLNALVSESAGSRDWKLSRSVDPASQAPLLTASIVREMPSKDYPENPQLYRLKLTCSLNTRNAEMQLTWSPQPATSSRTVAVALDGGAPLTYIIEGREKMGNGAKTKDGADATSGPAAAVLYATRPIPGAANLAMPLPARTLSISNLFPDETVAFPFDRLTQSMRQQLSECFGSNNIGR
jgi:hypothetical protein